MILSEVFDTYTDDRNVRDFHQKFDVTKIFDISVEMLKISTEKLEITTEKFEIPTGMFEISTGMFKISTKNI